jgi:Zn-dependent protease
MFQTVFVGKIAGIKVYIHWTFWILAIFVLMSSIGRGLETALTSLGFVFAVFGCVFLHEMGHAIAAKWYGTPTLDITLLPIGGVARIGQLPRSPIAELVVAIAGPAVNLAIAMLLLVIFPIQSTFQQVYETGIAKLGPPEQLFVANMSLAIFNLLPTYPMDGGRVLRSVLNMFMPLSLATIYTARVGQIAAIAMFMASFYVGFGMALISIWVFVVCSGELLKERFAISARQMQERSPFHPPTSDSVEDDGEAGVVDAVEVRRVR